MLQEKNFEHLKIGLDLIKEATKNFDDTYCIGSGGFGKVYKADLELLDSSNSSSNEGVDKCDLPKKRSTVAIKRIYNKEGEEGFIAEIETLTSCKHENIISLLGFCYEGNGEMILVYEHASKGSLENYLGNSDKMTTLTWVQRLKICLDTAHGTYVYLDPEYQKDGKLSKKSDIYSFGVVLLEILTGRLAYDSVYTKVNEKGIAPIARDHFKKGTIMEIVDHKIKEETDEHVFSLSKGPNKQSLNIFTEIALQCLAETQAKRPSIDVVINELKQALNSQENHKDSLKLSLEDIKLATQAFSQDNIIGHGRFGNIYKGDANHAHGDNIIAAKRLERKSAEGDAEFMIELEILMEYKHENVIGLVGYCDEEDEKISVYEFASRGSLDKYLSNASLTWAMRLKICIDIVMGLKFLHGTVSSPELVIHRDINSSNILLFDDWKAKLADFGLSFVCPTNQDVDYVIDNVTAGTNGYRDPLYSKTGFLTKESDIFSLGALLSFDGNGERNKMVSATTFSYINSCPLNWQSLPESRFDKVVKMSDISNLNINIKTNAQFLSPDVVYGVYLVFKFCDSRNFSRRPAYVNLKYRKGMESQHAYFATWRDKEWMMIELDRYSNQKEDVVFEFILQSFSTYQYGDGWIYVEGVEFRAIEK
ncbi:kinase-like domain, phloem protein 2-like protein, partial [Tanacetum coccineum]